LVESDQVYLERCATRRQSFLRILYIAAGIVVVLRSGSVEREKWQAEEVNFYDDYTKFFATSPDKVQGIGILTSSDGTKSLAIADYDDFVLLP
jgi:hypothetical protein